MSCVMSRGKSLAACSATMGQMMLAAAVTLATLAAVCAPASAEPIAAEVQKGQLLAEQMCAVCHLNPDQGDKSGPGTVPGFVAVAKRPGQTIEGIIGWLRSVPPMMPNHHLSQDEMEALAFYILSLADEAPDGATR